MKGFPDYMGNYMLLDDEEQMKIKKIYAGWSELEYKTQAENGAGIFFILMKNRQTPGQIVQNISGVILDNFSSFKSTFKGFLSNDSISFTKEYSKEAIESTMVPEEGIAYKAKKISPYIFKGIYNMPADERAPAWNGKFILLKYPEAVLRKISMSYN